MSKLPESIIPTSIIGSSVEKSLMKNVAASSDRSNWIVSPRFNLSVFARSKILVISTFPRIVSSPLNGSVNLSFEFISRSITPV